MENLIKELTELIDTHKVVSVEVTPIQTFLHINDLRTPDYNVTGITDRGEVVRDDFVIRIILSKTL